MSTIKSILNLRNQVLIKNLKFSLDGSYYDGAYLPGKKRLFFSETRKGIIYELTTQNLVRAAKAKGSSLPSKIVRFSKKKIV